MEIKVSIPDEKLQNLSPSANTEILKVAEHYVEEVLDEASRIEESRRTSTSNPEITASIISDAVNYAKTHGIRARKSTTNKILQFLAFFSTACTGWLFNFDKFNQPLYFILFFLMSLCAVLTNFHLIFNDNANG